MSEKNLNSRPPPLSRGVGGEREPRDFTSTWHLLASHAKDDKAALFRVAEATQGLSQLDLARAAAQVVVLTLHVEPVAFRLADQHTAWAPRNARWRQEPCREGAGCGCGRI